MNLLIHILEYFGYIIYGKKKQERWYCGNGQNGSDKKGKRFFLIIVFTCREMVAMRNQTHLVAVAVELWRQEGSEGKVFSSLPTLAFCVTENSNQSRRPC